MYEILNSLDFADFEISFEISRFHLKLQDFRRDFKISVYSLKAAREAREVKGLESLKSLKSRLRHNSAPEQRSSEQPLLVDKLLFYGRKTTSVASSNAIDRV